MLITNDNGRSTREESEAITLAIGGARHCHVAYFVTRLMLFIKLIYLFGLQSLLNQLQKLILHNLMASVRDILVFFQLLAS